MSTRAPFPPTKEAHGGRERSKYTRERIDAGGGKTASDLLPTADEKDALKGTSGTPSKSNKYATGSDSRLTDQRDAKSLQGRTVDTAAPADQDALKWDAGTSKWKPGTVAAAGGGGVSPNLLRAEATAALTLGAAAADVPGATLTLPDAGTWLVIGAFYFRIVTAGDGQPLGELVAGGATQTGRTTYLGKTTGEEIIGATQLWKITTTAPNVVVKLRGLRTGTTGQYDIAATHTTITAIMLSGSGTVQRTVVAEMTETTAAVEPTVGEMRLRDAVTDTLRVRFEIPKDYDSGDLTYTVIVRNVGAPTGVARFLRSRFRMRPDNTTYVVQESSVLWSEPNFTIADQIRSITATVLAADFQKGDVLLVDLAREGAHANDTLAASVTVDAVTVEYKAVVTATPKPIWEEIWEAFDANTDPVDKLIQSGAYRVFIFFSSQNAAAWKVATNAVYTVPAGKKLIVLTKQPSEFVGEDTANRQARFRNVTDGADVLAPTEFQGAGAGFPPWVGDVAIASKLTEVAAGKQVRPELWNADATKRAVGALVICREVAA